MNRIELLKEYMDQEPNDPFNIYALAIEYLNENIEKSLTYFTILINNFPTYLPTYYHIALIYKEKGEFETSLLYYKKGIELAKIQLNSKAEMELKRAEIALKDELID